MLLRPGGVPRAAIERVLGQPLADPPAAAGHAADAPVAPGQLASHYAPRTPVRLECQRVAAGEALLAFGPDLPPGAETAVAVLNLSPRGDLVEAAANLFGAICATSMAAGAQRDRGDADPARRTRRGDQRPVAPRRGAAAT